MDFEKNLSTEDLSVEERILILLEKKCRETSERYLQLVSENFRTLSNEDIEDFVTMMTCPPISPNDCSIKSLKKCRKCWIKWRAQNDERRIS